MLNFEENFPRCWKLLGWIVYLFLMACSVWCTWGVLEKFAKQEIAIRQYEEKIEAHPTITICIGLEYQNHFNITYTTYQNDGLFVEDEVVLKMGENDLKTSGGNVNLTTIYTAYNYICYVINTNRNVDEKETEIKIFRFSRYPFTDMSVFFTSEKNSYGSTRRDWRDGESYLVTISSRTKKDITLAVEKNINLKCREESFYEYVASRLLEQSFEICNDTCLMTSLPNDPYPICPNYEEWYDKTLEESNSDCSWGMVRNLMQNITNNDKHIKTCTTTQYSVFSQDGIGSDIKISSMKYKFTLSLKAKVYEEYYIIDSIGLIGSVGGTLGVFTGFSFNNLIICIIEYIKFLMKKKLRKPSISKKISSNTVWNCLEWIIYFTLMTIAILFAREVIEKFFGKNTGTKQNMESIKSHPTITICPFLHRTCAKPSWIGDGTCDDATNNEICEWDGGDCDKRGLNSQEYKGLPNLYMDNSLNYTTEFNVTYQTYKSDGLTTEEKVILKIGENHFEVSKEKVCLTKIYTRPNGICYKLNTTRKADFRKTKIKLNIAGSKILDSYITKFFFSSEDNSYGVTNNDFRDGKTFSTQIIGGKWKEIYLSIKKNKNLVCREESFFEYVASKLSDSSFENCTHTCLRTSLPSEHYPICQNYGNWYDNVLKGNNMELENDCNWSIVRNLIKNATTSNEYLKTCVTIDYYGKTMTEKNDQETIEYYGKIMTEKNDQESNELGICYKFAFPLQAKVYQEFLITDTIDLVGSVGGMLGLFIGFSFSSIITFIIEYIDTFLAPRKKLLEAIWVSIGWILYLSLMTTSIWFAWGVLDKFFKQETGIQQYEEQIKRHPTIVICMGSSKNETDFHIDYKVNWYTERLAIGKNYLETLNKTVNLAIIYTRYNGLCYAINTNRKVDEGKTSILLSSSSVDNLPETIPVIFTTEMNSYGITQRDWRDGEHFSVITLLRNSKSIDITAEKTINLNCSKQSFYEYVASRFSEENFEKSNDTCLMTSLPYNLYPICPNYDAWYDNDTKGKESNRNWQILRDLIQNITINEEHLKTCVTTQYLGKINYDQYVHNYDYAKIMYKFALPIKVKVYEEYLITDVITLIGSVGGTLSLFIGFSIINIVNNIMDFFKSRIETYFSRK